MRRISPTIFSSVLTVSASFVAASTASASIIFFDDAAAYSETMDAYSLSAYTQTFESYTGAAASFSGGTGNNAWTASSPNGVFGQAGVIRTLSASDTLQPFFSK